MMHWYNEAPGTVLVLIHGFTGTIWSWRDVAQALPKSLPVAALAVPGHHKHVPACRDFAATCDKLAHTLRRLGHRPAHVVGYSLGARLALGIAVRHPQLLQRVTFVGAHLGLKSAVDRQARCALDARWQTMLRTGGIDAFIESWERQPIFSGQQKKTYDGTNTSNNSGFRTTPISWQHLCKALALGQCPFMQHSSNSYVYPPSG